MQTLRYHLRTRNPLHGCQSGGVEPAGRISSLLVPRYIRDGGHPYRHSVLLPPKLQLHLEKDNSIEKIKNLDKVKTKKVVLKPIEIKDPRLYLPSSTNIKFDISKETQSEINKNKLKKNFHLDEIKENRFSPTNVDKNHKYNKFAKTTYVDYQKEIENERDYRLNNMSSSIPPQMNSTLIAYPKSECKIKLEEMITIKVLKRNKNLGIIKKMIHAPSLKIYTIKVISF